MGLADYGSCVIMCVEGVYMEKGNKWALVATGAGALGLWGGIAWIQQFGEKVGALSSEQQLSAVYDAALNVGDVLTPPTKNIGLDLIDLAKLTSGNIEHLGEYMEQLTAWGEGMALGVIKVLSEVVDWVDDWNNIALLSPLIIAMVIIANRGSKR